MNFIVSLAYGSVIAQGSMVDFAKWKNNPLGNEQSFYISNCLMLYVSP
jgi:hypothetical protein